MEKIRAEDEYHSLVYKKSIMEYQKLQDILRTLMDGDLFKLVEESLGGMFSSGSKQNDDQFLLQLLEYMVSKTRSYESSSVLVEQSLRTFPTPSRRSRQSPDIIQTLTDILGSRSQRSVGEVSADSGHSSGKTGESSFCRYNRPSLDTLRPPLAPTSATPPVVPPPSSYPPAVLQPPPPPPTRTATPRHPNRMPFNPQRP